MRAILLFFLLAFAWSWGVGAVGLSVRDELAVGSQVLMVAAGFGPSLAGAVVVGLLRGEPSHWLARCLAWRVSWRWYALAFALPPVVMGIAIGWEAATGGQLPVFPPWGHVPLAIVNFGLVLLIGGPLGEEFGWRGFALPALTPRLGWRGASLLVGVVWGLWHLPLFLVAGTVQSQMPLAVFLLNILAGSVVFAWLAERTGGSVLPALVLHTSLNGWSGLLRIVPTPSSWRLYGLVTGLLVLLALGLLVAPDRWLRLSSPGVARSPRRRPRGPATPAAR